MENQRSWERCSRVWFNKCAVLGSLLESPGEFAGMQLQNKPGVKHLCIAVLFLDILHLLTPCFLGLYPDVPWKLNCTRHCQGGIRISFEDFTLGGCWCCRTFPLDRSPKAVLLSPLCMVLNLVILLVLPPLCFPPPSVSHAQKLLHRGSWEVANFMCSNF